MSACTTNLDWYIPSNLYEMWRIHYRKLHKKPTKNQQKTNKKPTKKPTKNQQKNWYKNMKKQKTNIVHISIIIKQYHFLTQNILLPSIRVCVNKSKYSK